MTPENTTTPYLNTIIQRQEAGSPGLGGRRRTARTPTTELPGILWRPIAEGEYLPNTVADVRANSKVFT